MCYIVCKMLSVLLAIDDWGSAFGCSASSTQPYVIRNTLPVVMGRGTTAERQTHAVLVDPHTGYEARCCATLLHESFLAKKYAGAVAALSVITDTPFSSAIVTCRPPRFSRTVYKGTYLL